MKQRMIVGMMGFVLAVIVTGCNGTGRYNLKVRVDREDWDRTVRVDVIGVTRTDYARMQAVDLNDYFRPNSTIRRDVDKATFQFGQEQPVEQRLSKRDVAWRRWERSGAFYLFVLADLPGVFIGEGEADLRRLVLPLRKKRWSLRVRRFGEPIEIEVQASRIRLLTPCEGVKK